MAFELVSGATLRCLPHHFSSLTRWSGSRGHGREMAEKGQNLKHVCLFRGLIATKQTVHAESIHFYRIRLQHHLAQWPVGPGGEGGRLTQPVMSNLFTPSLLYEPDLYTAQYCDPCLWMAF